MKGIKAISAIILAAVLATVIGCAPTPTREGTGEYFDDTVITTKVKAALLNEASLKSFDIKVDTFKGTVQLSGFVASKADISRAVEVTRHVPGVTAVRNDILLK